jgi:hypothetical protein
MGDYPFGSSPSLQRQAATPLAGVALVNGTPTILSWTAPNDGQQHRALIWANAIVGTATVGGAVNVTWTDPSGTGQAWTILPGTQASTGWEYSISQVPNIIIKAGTPVTVTQTALTAGASTVYAEIWGA